MTFDALGENPGPSLYVCARVSKFFPMLPAEPLCPTGVDLHEAIVIGAVAVVSNGIRIEVAFMFGDAPEEQGRYSVCCPGFFEAEG